MDSNTKRSAVLSGILESRQRDSEGDPRDAFKDVRQAIPTPMLDIVLAGGDIESFSYAYLTQVSFTPGDTITLYFGETKVVIDGQNLAEMREKIRLHKADGIQEGTEAESDLKADSAAHVSRIEIEKGEDERKERGRETGRTKNVER